MRKVHMLTKTWNRRGGLRPLLLGGLVVLASGCSLDVVNPGAITDESLNTADLMPVVVNGIANEFNQNFDNQSFDVLRMTDEAAGTGSYFETGRQRRGAVDWDETSGDWAQFHETIWTGRSAWELMGNIEDYDRDSSVDAARAWLMIGHAHRFFGEVFCQVVYSVGPTVEEAVQGGVLPRTATFDSAIVALNKAITIAQAAGGSLADSIVTAARGGIAQAYANKGDFTNAITYSVQVPTAFTRQAHFNPNSNENLIFNETHDRNEIGLYNTYAGTLATQDPRVPYTICGTFDDPANPKNSKVTSTGNCPGMSPNGADGVTAHYRQDKYMDANGDSDINFVSGVDMRLIEAEAALLANDMGTFADRINEVRNHFGLGALTGAVAAAGALEYPNAYDANTGDVTAAGVDAWSILDAERHLTLWGEGRRLYDLHRWNHPFLDGGVVFWDAEPRRVSCKPIPKDECTLNQFLRESNPTLLTGVGNGTQTCS